MAEFTEEELAADAVTADTPEPEQQLDRARDESGRFAAAEKAEEVEQPEQRNRQVPHQALHAEREGHKHTRAQLEEAQTQLRTIAEMRARIIASQPAAVEPKSAEEDPTGVAYLKERLGQVETSLHQRDQREQYTATVSQRYSTLQNTLSASEAAYEATKPDYKQAADHLINARARQLSLLGVQGQALADMIREEAADLTETAINQGRDPADLIYEYAQSYGYQPGAAQQGSNPTLDAIARGQKSRSLSSARGGSGANDVNATAIAEMDEGEFAHLYNTDPKFRQLADRLG
jgi:hypothetical protein